MLSIIAFALVSVLAASAADIQVNVGANNQLIFEPNQVTAQPGDSLHFQFQSKNHSVTQSTFTAPCVRSPTGVDSGFMPVNASATSQPVWILQVTDTTPLWFFCAQTLPAVHCTSGMVFAVNPTANKTFQQFQSTATGGAASNGTSASGAASASNGTSASGVASASSASGAASVTPTDVIPAPTSLPGAAGSGAAAAPSQSGLVTVVGGTATSETGTAASASTSSPSNSTNNAIGLSSGGAFSLVPMFAAVAGFML